MLKMILTVAIGIFFASCAASGVEYSKARLAGHRGESELAPENTMASFAQAWKNAETIVETDIQLTKDGQVVICHDADTFRTSGKKTKLVIKDSTLEDIRKVDVGAWKGPQWAGQVCPTLKELYDAMPAGTACYTEIKSGIDVVPAFLEIVKESGKGPEQIVVISFHADALAASKKALPGYKHYLLANHKKDKQGNYLTKPNVEEWIETAKRIGADGLDLQVTELLDRAACEKIRAAGLELHVWTVDDAAVAKKYLDWGAQSVTTNRPSAMRRELGKFENK
jgi:glycerophosphoryl diester phosphodiesterase